MLFKVTYNISGVTFIEADTKEQAELKFENLSDEEVNQNTDCVYIQEVVEFNPSVIGGERIR